MVNKENKTDIIKPIKVTRMPVKTHNIKEFKKAFIKYCCKKMFSIKINLKKLFTINIIGENKKKENKNINI